MRRIRPKMMTVCAAFTGLLPVMWSIGTGADVMKRIAAPIVGGLFTSFALELLPRSTRSGNRAPRCRARSRPPPDPASWSAYGG